MKFFAACAFALFVGVAGAPARTLTSGNPAVALDVPDNWVDAPNLAHLPPPAELIAGVTSPDGKRGCTALRAALKPNEADGYTKGLLDSLTKQGFTLSEKVPVVIGGVTFDSYTGTPAAAAKPLLQVFSTMADSHAYALSIVSQAGDPRQDTELQAIVQSFHFLAPPQPFKKTSTAFEIGRVIGTLACPVIGLLLIGGIGAAIYFLVRKKK